MSSVHTFTTYMSPEDRFGIVYEHAPRVGRTMGWTIELSDPVQFSELLLESIAECESTGRVVVQQGTPPLPDYISSQNYDVIVIGPPRL